MPESISMAALTWEDACCSFKRVMLQASVSIKAGADVVSSLQSIIDQLSQERVIELRRYGLSQYVEKADKDLKKRHIELSQLERSLWQIRDQRLKEATAILSGAS